MPVQMLSVAQIADATGVSKMTIFRLIDDGDLIAYRVGRSIRIRADDFAEFMKAARVKGKAS